MSGPLGSQQWMYASGGYQIEDSLRFNDNDSAYLSRTPASAGNSQIWTYSAWLKRTPYDTTGTLQDPFSAGTGAQNRFELFFGGADTLSFYMNTSGTVAQLSTSMNLRDPTGWYHLVVSVDTTQATASNRVKMYVNGEQVTSFSTSTYPTLNRNTPVNSVTPHYIGKFPYNSSRFYDGYISDVYFIDGQALDPTDFGETINGYWRPIAYEGTYGTNGFYLNFSADSYTDNGSDPDVFADQAGSNNWNAYNIAVEDIVPDSPTNNFAVLNPLVSLGFGSNGNGTLSEGNLKCVWSGVSVSGTRLGTIGVSSGKWYYEADWEQNGSSTAGYGFIGGDGSIDDGRLTISTSGTYMCAVDMDNLLIWYGVDGVWTGDPDAGTGGTSIPDAGDRFPFLRDNSGSTGNDWTVIANFGQDSTFADPLITAGGNTDARGIGDFAYAPPSGYLALCTANLPTPTITDGSEYFNTVLYTGTGATQSITGVGFQPDLTWIKQRSPVTRSHRLNDSVRGANKQLYSELPNSEGTLTTELTSFDSDGFSLGSANGVNNSSDTYVAWNWKAGGAASTIAVDTYGAGVPSIASQVSANTDAGFSIVSYTGNGTDNATVGHGLNQTPDIVIIKNRDDSRNWTVWGYGGGLTSVFTTPTSGLELNTTDTLEAFTGIGTDLLATTFRHNIASFANNNLDDNYIAYCFHRVEGYSKAGSYTGNGSAANGPFVYTGFRPAWVMIRNATPGGSNWDIMDSVRSPFNIVDTRLYANLDNSEPAATDYVDFTSNGFKIRNTATSQNASGRIYIYLAFAETPFKYANAR